MLRSTKALAVAGALLVVLGFASPAYANVSSVHVSGGVVRFDAARGVDNRVTVVQSGFTVTITDPSGPLVAGDNCTLLDPHRAVCVGVQPVFLDLWDGDDTLDASATSRQVVADLGVGTDSAVGGAGADTLVGGSGVDSLNGGAGDDTLEGSDGADRVWGGVGVDVASYRTHSVPVYADLDLQLGDDGALGEGDTIFGDVEGLLGGVAADRLTGNASPNKLLGSWGDDFLDARDGRGGDLVDGNAGRDQCRTDAGDTRVACP